MERQRHQGFPRNILAALNDEERHRGQEPVDWQWLITRFPNGGSSRHSLVDHWNKAFRRLL